MTLHPMNLRVLLLVFTLPSLALATGASEAVSIFDGETLSGWELPPNNQWWSAGAGVLTARSGPRKKGSILWTKQRYGNFDLELEFRMGSEGIIDSGVFLRSEKEQIQIGISGSKKRDMTASPYIAGKGYPVEATGVAGLLKPTDWNAMRIRAVGSAYTVWLNGCEVMTYTSPTAVKEGPIGLQLHHGRDMNIEFRNLRVSDTGIN